jgi:hypothetical protein
MNIFYVDSAPRDAAQALCDKHISKMVVETAQLLSAAHHLTDSPQRSQCYKLTHQNHPCSVWVRASNIHYDWTYVLFRELAYEFTWRRAKIHETYNKLSHVLCHTPQLPSAGWVDPPQCMPDQFKGDDAAEAYRRYYHSKEFATWTWGRQPPEWWQHEDQ